MVVVKDVADTGELGIPTHFRHGSLSSAHLIVLPTFRKLLKAKETSDVDIVEMYPHVKRSSRNS